MMEGRGSGVVKKRVKTRQSRLNMDVRAPDEGRYRFGPFLLDPAERSLTRDGAPVALTHRVFETLMVLVRHPGQMVSKDELMEAIWPGRYMEEGSLKQAIFTLRKVLGGDTDDTQYIVTAPGRGYSFSGTVERIASSQTREAIQTESTLAPSAALSRSDTQPMPVTARSGSTTRWRAGRRAVAVIVAAALLIGGAVSLVAVQRWLATPQPANAEFHPPPRSVAVLAFTNMSGDPKQEYFSDGFSEELINNLANEPHLNVASRTSSFTFKRRNETIGAIARALNVHAVVEGSVREVGDRVRITAQLIDASDGYHLWSADYTRNLSDILSVQDELARIITAQLTHRLAPEPGVPRPRIDPAVYRLFLTGIEQYRTPYRYGWRSALATFRQVTEKAPDFADGFAYFASTAGNLALNYDAAPASGFAVAEEAAIKALALDSRNMLARSVLGGVALDAWNWRAGAAVYRILRKQNPDNMATVSSIWIYYVHLGFPDEALAEWRLSDRQPKSYRDRLLITLYALDTAGRFHEEISVAQTQLVLNQRDPNRLAYLCSAYAATGQIEEARLAGERLRSLQTDFDSIFDFQDCQFYIDLVTGNRPDALRLLHIWESEFPDNPLSGPNITGISAGAFGASYVLLGDFDKASGWFERAYERREPDFFAFFFNRGFGFESALEKYRLTSGYKALEAKPLFKDWQAEHDRIAAALAAHRDPLN